MASDNSPREEPRISIICRTVGRALLAEALESVSAQRYPNIELLVVDAKGDGLPDWTDTLTAANARVISQQQPLPRAEAANAGLEAASGDYILFLDEDDWIDPDHLRKLAAALKDQEELAGVYSAVCKTTFDGSSTDIIFSQPFDQLLLLRENFIPIHAMLFARRVLDAGCRFDTQFDIFEDWDFWLQVSQHGDFLHIPGVTAYYRAGGDSQTAASEGEDDNQRYRGDNPMAKGRSKLFDKWLHHMSGAQFNALLGSMDQGDELDSLSQTIGSLNEQVKQQAGIANLQQQEAARLAEQLDSSIKQSVELNKVLEQTQSQNFALQHQLTDLAKLHEQTRHQLSHLEQQHEETVLELQHTRLRRAALEQEVQKLRQTFEREVANYSHHVAVLEGTLNAIYASRGWRLMGPARRLMRALRSIRGTEPVNVTADAPPEQDDKQDEPAKESQTAAVKPSTIVHCAIDLAVSCDGCLYLRGWASAEGQLEKIELRSATGHRIEIERTQFRQDIAEAFPNHADAELAGFYVFIESDSVDYRLKFFESGRCVKTLPVKARSVAGFAELSRQGEFVYLDLQTQYDIYRWEEQRRDQARESLLPSLEYTPLISIIVPVFNVEAKWLDACVKSVLQQSYENWQLCLHDDKSTEQETLNCLERWARHDDRIRVQYGEENQHISGASNSALKLAEGEFIGLMDNDDELHPLALEYVVSAINQNPDGDYFYTDEDKIDEQGRHCQPHFKPDWSPTLLESMMYVGHFGVIRRSCIDQVGGFRKGYEGSQDFDLTLRISEITDRFIHIPKVLYHWRIIPGSVSGGSDAKSYAYDAAVKALSDHAVKQSDDAEVCTTEFPGLYQIKRKWKPEQQPSVAIIMPFHNKPEMTIDCLESVFASGYKNLDVIAVSNNSSEEAVANVASYLEDQPRSRLLIHDVPFNWSAINNFAASKTAADYLLFLNNDMKVISEDWIERLLDIGCKDKIGATGARLLFDDNTVQHAGIVIGLGGIAGHSFKYMGDTSPGYFGYAAVAREVSAVTGACMLVKRSVFEEVSGFDESLAVAYNDVDFCLRLKQAGYSTAYTPFASLYHFESKTRPKTPEQMSSEERRQFNEESDKIRARHASYFESGDPLYNPSLTLLLENYSLRVPEAL